MADEEQPKPSGEELPKEDLPWKSGENFLTNMSEEERKKYLGWAGGPQPGEQEEKPGSDSKTAQSEEDAND